MVFLGINAAKRGILSSTSPTIEITFDGTNYKEVIKTKLKDHTLECKINEAFTHEVPELGGSMAVRFNNKYFAIIG